MRRLWWLVLGLVIVAAAIWLPSVLVERRVAGLFRQHIERDGSVDVRARTSLVAIVRGRVDTLSLDARRVRLGDLAARQMTGHLSGVELVRSASGRWTIGRVERGEAQIEIGAADLERLLAQKGIGSPTVTINTRGVEATGVVRIGPVTGAMKVSGEFYTLSGRDLLFRVTALEVLDASIPPTVANAALGVVQIDVSLGALPFPMKIERIDSGDGRVLVRARVEEGAR